MCAPAGQEGARGLVLDVRRRGGLDVDGTAEGLFGVTGDDQRGGQQGSDEDQGGQLGLVVLFWAGTFRGRSP